MALTSWYKYLVAREALLCIQIFHGFVLNIYSLNYIYIRRALSKFDTISASISSIAACRSITVLYDWYILHLAEATTTTTEKTVFRERFCLIFCCILCCIRLSPATKYCPQSGRIYFWLCCRFAVYLASLECRDRLQQDWITEISLDGNLHLISNSFFCILHRHFRLHHLSIFFIHLTYNDAKVVFQSGFPRRYFFCKVQNSITYCLSLYVSWVSHVLFWKRKSNVFFFKQLYLGENQEEFLCQYLESVEIAKQPSLEYSMHGVCLLAQQTS